MSDEAHKQFELAVLAERIDAEAWIDQFNRAAPPHVQQALGMHAEQRGDLVLVRSHVPFCHFRCVTGLGLPATADAETLAAIDHFYSEIGADRYFVLWTDFCKPADLPQVLKANGYKEDDLWDRIVCHGAPVDRWAGLGAGCELITDSNKEEWAQFILDCYSMPPIIGDWLRALVGRPGWLHALRREGGNPQGKVVMVRSLFHNSTGWSWLGIDAPVPGVMAPCFEDDQHVTVALLEAASKRGVKAFVTDIEAPCATRDSEAYKRWGALGFSPVYKRQLYVKDASK